MEQSNNGSNTRSEDVGCGDEGLGDGFGEMGWAGEMNREREDGHTMVVGEFI